MSFKLLGNLLLAAAVVAAIVIFSYYSDINSPISNSGAPVKFTVAPGENIKEIGRNLQKAGLIKSEFHFKFYIWQTKNGARIQAGNYQLSPRMTIKDIVAALSAGKIINEEKEITIVPGWNLRDIYNYLQVQAIVSSTAFYQLSGEPEKKYASGKLPDFSKEFSILIDKPKSYGLEGYLFPDTYRIFNQASAQDVIEKMLGNLDAKFTPAMRDDIAQKGKTVYQVITLASIIEKEVSKTDDMKIVSGIFSNRLAIGQPLGSDATLSYILSDNNAAHSIEQTKIDSPYNTYRYAGLPPGPICNPSLDAIKAAIYPAATDYYYFLTDPKSGKTVFSKTLEEHNRNKQKYLR